MTKNQRDRNIKIRPTEEHRVFQLSQSQRTSIELVSKKIQHLQQQLANSLAPFVKIAGQLSQHSEIVSKVEASGILPHSSTPWHLVSGELDAENLGEVILQFYRENWQTIEFEIYKNAITYQLDPESLETFKEALYAHKCGLYRSVVRLLLPEVERVVRSEFNDGKPGHISNFPAKIGQLSLAEVMDIESGFPIFRKIRSHLYRNVKSQTDVDDLMNDAVPNRHAAIHGIVAYNSYANSLNTIIMADFMFNATSKIKQRSKTPNS